MKKALCLFVSVLLMFSLSTAVLAEEAWFETVYELYESWEKNNNTPEWVSNISSTDGSGDHLTITLVAGHEDKEQLLRDMIKDESTLTVVTGGAYSEADLQHVYDEISEKYMAPEGPVVGIGIGWAVIDGQITGFGESGTESRVCVTVLEEDFDEYSKLLTYEYGDMVYVESGSIATMTEDGGKEHSSIGIIGGADGPTAIFVSGSIWPLIAGGILVLLVIAGIIVLAKKKTK